MFCVLVCVMAFLWWLDAMLDQLDNVVQLILLFYLSLGSTEQMYVFQLMWQVSLLETCLAGTQIFFLRDLTEEQGNYSKENERTRTLMERKRVPGQQSPPVSSVASAMQRRESDLWAQVRPKSTLKLDRGMETWKHYTLNPQCLSAINLTAVFRKYPRNLRIRIKSNDKSD